MSRWAVDGFLSSIKHGTRNLWDIYMVTTVEINTDRAVMVHQISTINEWIPICGYYEQHKKWLFKGLLIRKVKEAAAKSQGPFVPTPEPKYWRTRSTRFGQNFHRELVTAKGKGKKNPKWRWDTCTLMHTKYTHSARLWYFLPGCALITFLFLCSLRWRWSLRMWWTEAYSRRATVTSAMPSSSLSPSARPTTRWVVRRSPRAHRRNGKTQMGLIWKADSCAVSSASALFVPV